MELTRKVSIVSILILCVLLLHSGPVLADNDDCWTASPDFGWCKTAKCRGHCVDRGFVDGRCNWKFPDLGVCECRNPNCKHTAAGPDHSRD
ncbi:hypothetical protein BRADI_2g22600v3 [Brachypodium distachyon]|uniref:Knottin scorpion toxin-like domain-containing protein n=1 Tax=Brachypodium distachyon TaxID=15368 RepID=I1HII8_BRADI|nr:hypothetical protein BRADI_2g22600v3 [Brachypodium distachyon]